MRHQFSGAAKWLVPIAVLASAAMLLSGCSTPKAAPTSGIKGVNITFGGWGGQEAATKADFSGFMSGFEKSTGAKVQYVGATYAQSQQQLELRAKSSNPVDVAQVDIGWITSYAAQNQLVDLNTVYGKKNLEALYPENYLKLGQRDGKQVALPWTIASIALVANTDLLKQAGVNKTPTTTAEFTAALEAIKKAEPDVIPYALNTKTPALVQPFTQPWLWTFGGSIYGKNGSASANTSGNAKALSYLTGLVNDGLAPKDMDIFTARTLFAQGKVAFYDDAIIAKGLVGKASFASSVLPIPRPVAKAGDAPQSEQWGHALVMFKKKRSASELDAAKAFMTHLETPSTVNAYFKSQGLLPATKAGLKAQASSTDKYSTTWAAISTTSRPDETAGLVNGAQVATIVGTHTEGALVGTESSKAAAEAIAKELTQLGAN